MTTREHINEYFNGRPFMILSALALVVATVVATSLQVAPPQVAGTGIFFSLRGTLIEPGPLSATLNLLCLLATGAIMLALNKVYGYIRSVTYLMASAFYLLQAAHLSSLAALNIGSLMALVTSISLMPLFASYQDKHAQRSIFLIFALTATGSMFHYGFLALIPAYLLGFLNMRALGPKGLLAMIFGLVTPFWIVLGLGLVAPGEAIPPSIDGVWHALEWPNASTGIIVATVTALLGIVLMAINLPVVMNYRMQPRVYNIALAILLVMTIVAMYVDYRDMVVFLPLIHLMVAVQVAQTHVLHSAVSHRYVFLIVLIACCFAATRLMMP